MRQALHIFKKDVRYLRIEICFLLALSAVIGWLWGFSRGSGLLGIMLAIGAAYLIERLVHAESIPGENQFWVTRPYRWQSLLGAKLLFILVFVNLPIFAARLFALVLTMRFPLEAVLPGLLWSQLLMIVAASLPVAALAAVTRGVVPFIFSALTLATIAFGLEEMVVPPFFAGERLLVLPVQWVWDSIAILTLVVAAVPILYVQYKRRRTAFSRAFGLSVMALGTAAFVFVPWPVALAVQTGLSKRALDTSSIQIEFDPGAKTSLIKYRWGGVRLDLPIAVKGIPDGVDARADAVAVTMEGADGWKWKSGVYRLPGLLQNQRNSDTTIFNAIVDIDPVFFNQHREQTVSLHASLYLTFFGDPQVKTILRGAPFAYVADGLRCSLWGRTPIVDCVAPFRWPARVLSADMRPLQQPISYSPFPAGLSLDLYGQGWAPVPESAHEVKIIAKEALANVRMDLEAPDVRLADLRCTY